MARLRRGLGNRNMLPADTVAREARRLRRKKVGELATIGVSQYEIARQLGISRSQVHKDIEKFFAEHEAEDAQSYRAKANANYNRLRLRLETIISSHAEEARKDPRVASVVGKLTGELRKIQEAQARLNGAEIPARLNVEHSGQVANAVVAVSVSLDEALATAEHNAAPVIDIEHVNGTGRPPLLTQ